MIHMGHEIFQILASKRMLSKLSESIGQTNMVVFRQVPDHLAEDFQFIARLGQVYTQVWRWSQQNYLYVFFKGFFYHLRSEEHTSELQSLMRISYAVFCLKKKTPTSTNTDTHPCYYK